MQSYSAIQPAKKTPIFYSIMFTKAQNLTLSLTTILI